MGGPLADQLACPAAILRHDDDKPVDIEPKRRRRGVAALPREEEGVHEIGKAGATPTVRRDDGPVALLLAREADEWRPRLWCGSDRAHQDRRPGCAGAAESPQEGETISHRPSPSRDNGAQYRGR